MNVFPTRILLATDASEEAHLAARTAVEIAIGEGEVTMPVVEEEAVVGKQSVVKEDLRIRKDVVEDEEVVEEDVRKEEVDVEDRTERRNR